jgi:hypothetical protein
MNYGEETRLGARRPGFESRQGKGFSSLRHRVQTGSGEHQPPTQRVTGALSPGIKWPGCEADYSPPSSEEFKNEWSYSSTPPIRLHGLVLN